MSDPFDGLIVVPAGPSAYQRALIVAVRLYGPDVELNQVGWGDDELASFEVVDEIYPETRTHPAASEREYLEGLREEPAP